MSTFPWKVSGKGVLRSGVVEATSDREALNRVLGGSIDLGFSPKGDESYSITVGPLTTSAYGDEFERVAGAHSIDETDLDMSQGHLFNDPVRKKLLDSYASAEDAERYLATDDKTVDTCKEKFNNHQNFGGWGGDPMDVAKELIRSLGVPPDMMGIQPPGQQRAPVVAGDPDKWELEAHSDVDFEHYIGRLGAPRPIVTRIRKELRATFSGAAAQAIRDAVRNGDAVSIQHSFGGGPPEVFTFIPSSTTQHADGSVDVEGPVIDQP